MSIVRLMIPAAAALASCTPTPTEPAPTDPAIEVGDAWARATVAGQSTGAIYATIVNRGAADTLTGVASDGGMAMLHGNQNSGGVSRMRMVEAMPINGGTEAAGETVALAPGGTHVMLMGMAKPLTIGDKLNLTLRFAKSGERRVPVTIVAPGAR